METKEKKQMEELFLQNNGYCMLPQDTFQVCRPDPSILLCTVLDPGEEAKHLSSLVLFLPLVVYACVSMGCVVGR